MSASACRRDRSARPLRLRFFLLLATLLAFSWQNFLAEVHQHYRTDTDAVVAAKSVGDASSNAPGQSPDSPANCPLCRELVHAAFYMPPPALLALVAPLLAALAPLPVAGFQLLGRRRSYRWQSRAPPQPLQA